MTTLVPNPIAFIPLSTLAELIDDATILATVAFASAQGCKVQINAYAAEIPQIYAPIGDVAFDMQSLIASAASVSKIEADRLMATIKAAHSTANFTYDEKSTSLYGSAAVDARRYDLALLPWQAEAVLMQEMAEAVIFGAGRPVILVPQNAQAAKLTHLAVAWDDSRVAARALNDALPLLDQAGQITVLTATEDPSAAIKLAATLALRGYNAQYVAVDARGKAISLVLQEAAQSCGAGLLAMGGFGHSRLRDFVLGGATKGVLGDLKLPVLLSH